MESNNEPEHLQLRSEDPGFSPAEMIACVKCTRPNPPNRLRCIYCGVELELSDEQAGRVTPVLRKLEGWENGFNIVASATDNANSGALAKIAGLDAETAIRLAAAKVPLPVARAESEREASIIATRLGENGFSAQVVSDIELAPDTMPKRLRGIEFDAGELVLIAFNNDEVERLPATSLTLIVNGAIIEKSIESTEKRKKGQSTILDATETASDDVLFDFYSDANPLGWRVMTKGFDFSCLGDEKGIVARDNIKRLAARLRELAPHARFVDDYMSLRGLIGEVWEVEQRKDSRGLTRQRFGKFDLSTVASSSNQRQFTKYSRLQRHLL